MLPVLSRNYMDFGVSTDVSSYYMYLYQQGGSIYNDQLTEINFHSDESVNAFTTWTNLFSNYQFLISYNFINRFRYGEMPIAIADYTTYGSILLTAPELQGLWDFSAIPGTVREDGTISRAASGGGSGCVILSASPNVKASWEFLKWWVSADTQYRYAESIESRLGTSARPATANMQALSYMPWSKKQLEVITGQLGDTYGIPEVVGGYYITRQINNAFRKIVYDRDMSIRDVLLDYEKKINDEMKSKRMELHLSE